MVLLMSALKNQQVEQWPRERCSLCNLYRILTKCARTTKIQSTGVGGQNGEVQDPGGQSGVLLLPQLAATQSR